MIQEEELVQTIAINCGRLRRLRRLTFDALARRAGISKGALVEIEQGRTNPAISTLCRLANALAVDLGELLGRTTPAERFAVRSSATGRPFWETKTGSRATLIDTARVGEVAAEIWYWRLAAGEFFDGESHPPGTIEFLSVLRGTLSVQADRESAAARAGSILRFRADTPHRYCNLRKVACEFQMVVVEAIE